MVDESDTWMFLGSYDKYGRTGEKLVETFLRFVEQSESRKKRREVFGQYQNFPYELLGACSNAFPVKKIDPLIDELEKILADIQKLKAEADEYNFEHINQDFRRINANLIQCQLKLDQLDLQGREDARQLRKKGIRDSESGANTLMEKIHKTDYRDCTVCLKL